jgi:multiple sugar transport system ATP-binding protein
MATVAFEGVGKVYRDGTRALADFDLEVADGEFIVFVGPSGCGKTTALRMVAGLEDISEGEIKLGGVVVNGLHPRKRDIAMVFQNYALYPHMTVYKNIAFALRVRKIPEAEIRTRVEATAKILGLTPELNRKPAQLSGGQRQRVAMGRAIVRNPQAFLMDEPLSNLDAKLRVQMRAEIARIQREVQATTIYVTHDQVEAMTMGDRVAVLRKGALQQCDAPQVLYEHPVNLFVASFIGSPAMNLVQARIEQDGEKLACVIGSQRLEPPPTLLSRLPAIRAYVGRTVALGVRPEHLQDATLADHRGVRADVLRGRVVTTEQLGSEVLAHVEVDAAPVVTQEVLEVAGDTDRALAEDLRSDASERRTTFVCRFSTETSVRAGDEALVSVATDKLQFFDLETEMAIGP